MESSSRPLGVSGKELPPNRNISGQAPPGLSRITPSSNTGTTTSDPDPATDILRMIVERTEQGNLRIRRLNDLRKQRRLVSCGLEDISSNEEEEDVPELISLLVASMRPNSITSAHLPISQPDPVVSEATGSNALDIGT